MIDQFVIFERGGTILWSRNYVIIKGDPLSQLVRTVLLEDRLSLSEISIHNYTLKWTLDNTQGLFFVVIYQKQLPPPYANDLLQLVKKHFIQKETLSFDPSTDYEHFSSTFNNLLTTAEQRCSTAFSYNSNITSSTVSIAATEEEESTKKKKKKKKKKPKNSTTQQQNEQEEQKQTENDSDNDDNIISSEDVIKNREAFLKKRTRTMKKTSNNKPSKSDVPFALDDLTTATTATKPRKKIMRPGKTKQEDLSALDFSEGKPPNADEMVEEETQRFKEQYLEAERNEAFDDILESDVDEDEDEDEDEEESEDYDVAEDKNKSNEKSLGGGLVNYFKGLAGMRSLSREDLAPAMDKFRDELVSKNVAKDIADKLMESVMTSLEGQTMESMTSISTMVRKSLEEALTRILTPRQSTDLLSEIATKRSSSKDPYVITFCGVNGVGKSTSLAKTCFFLLNHGYKVLIAACDTFRAGAVEQLRTHVRCLGRGVELFDRGYGKDAAAVASDAIRKAKELKMDVVLIDTAGRMQDNEPLMRALAKLVEVNHPDRVLFVGEALVGNDAVDQLTKFNQALMDYQTGYSNRLIDGIVLTKFDTIDDKVGAAVSMVYTTGQPIVFIGIGQTYMDLRKLNTKSLVKALLKL